MGSSSHLIDIIIPTYNSPHLLVPCVNSIIKNWGTPNLFRIIVINNGHPDSLKDCKHDAVDIVQAGSNLGWEGGLKLGLSLSKTPFVVFMNDDTLVPSFSHLWLNKLLGHFHDKQCAAVGPVSNFVSGTQSIFADLTIGYPMVFRTMFLIGFCVMIRRSYLNDVGGIDGRLPGGDDFDLSIRLRDAGHYLLVDRNVFVFHHGQMTGKKVHGDYWDSSLMQERVALAVIKKHGMYKYWQIISAVSRSPFVSDRTGEDSEGRMIRDMVSTLETVVELGCGPKKTVPWATGVDLIPGDELIPNLESDDLSVADVVHDVSRPLPFADHTFDVIIARHILEHLLDPLEALRNWSRILRCGGRMIIAVPNQDICNSIPMNVEHVHAFNPASLKNLMESVGFKEISVIDPQNTISFIGNYEKLPIQHKHHELSNGVKQHAHC